MVRSDDDMGMPCARTRPRWFARLYKTALRARILVRIEFRKENVDLEKPGRQGRRWRPARKRVLRTDRDVRDQDRSGVAIPPEGIWPIVQATPREHEIDK